jgi:hypothetical protein
VSDTPTDDRWHEVYMTVLGSLLTPVPMFNQMYNCGPAYAPLDVDAAHARAKSVADKAYPKALP